VFQGLQWAFRLLVCTQPTGISSIPRGHGTTIGGMCFHYRVPPKIDPSLGSLPSMHGSFYCKFLSAICRQYINSCYTQAHHVVHQRLRREYDERSTIFGRVVKLFRSPDRWQARITQRNSGSTYSNLFLSLVDHVTFMTTEYRWHRCMPFHTLPR
jgi:hypothetical protein